MTTQRFLNGRRPARLACLAAIAIAGSGFSLHAQLILHLDTATKEFWFAGSATGTPHGPPGPDDGFYSEVLWAVGTGTPAVLGDDFVGLGGANIAVTGNDYSGAFLNTSAIGSKIIGDYEYVRVLLDDSVLTTLTGTGTKASYGGFSAASQSALEANLGSILPLVEGTGFGDLSVVPEPHEHVLAAGLGLAAFTVWRRHRRRN